MLTISSLDQRASLTCLLGFEQCVEEFFAVVKGVGDVLVGRWSWVLTCSSLVSRASVTCLLGVSRVLRSSSQLSRASLTCLLGFEQCVEEFFAVVKGVGDVLVGRWS